VRGLLLWEKREIMKEDTTLYMERVTIKATNIELTPALRALIDKKVSMLTSRISKWSDEGVAQLHIEVGTTGRHHRKGNTFYAEANLDLPGAVLRATHTDTTLPKAITAMKNILKERIEAYRETHA
jgi:ribosomal subunit interface protein